MRAICYLFFIGGIVLSSTRGQNNANSNDEKISGQPGSMSEQSSDRTTNNPIDGGSQNNGQSGSGGSSTTGGNGGSNSGKDQGNNGQSGSGVDKNCQDEFETFHQCLKNSRDQRETLINQQRQESENKTKDQVTQCFSKNNCQQPSFDNFKGRNDIPKSAGAGDFERRRQCSKQVEDKVRFTIEQCVQKTNPTFRFPKTQETNADQKTRPRAAQLGNIGKAINASCPASSQEAVKACMADVWKQQSAGIGAKQRQIESRFNQSCQSQNTCFKAMSAKCQSQITQMKQAACDCAQQLTKPQFDEQYNICMGKNSTANGRTVQSMTMQMCNNIELCQHGLAKDMKGKIVAGNGDDSSELKSDDDE